MYTLNIIILNIYYVLMEGIGTLGHATLKVSNIEIFVLILHNNITRKQPIIMYIFFIYVKNCDVKVNLYRVQVNTRQ